MKLQFSLILLFVSLLCVLFEGTACGAQNSDAAPVLRQTLPVPVVSEPAPASLDRTHGEQWHRVRLKLSGSMCPACLLELEQKLRKQPGVAFAAIHRPSSGPHDSDGAGTDTTTITPRTAETTIIYNAHAVSLDTFKRLFKQDQYKWHNVEDNSLDSRDDQTGSSAKEPGR